jgi:Na+-transporting methylmalonyl-CoA/oxaloacetate decarboxylase gamma subunit
MSSPLAEGLALSLIGFLITFGVLALIALFVRLVRGLDQRWRAWEEAARRAPADRRAEIDDLTLVLVAAAVATLVGGRGRIRSIRRLLPADSPQSAWAVQGRMVLMGSHVITRHGR